MWLDEKRNGLRILILIAVAVAVAVASSDSVSADTVYHQNYNNMTAGNGCPDVVFTSGTAPVVSDNPAVGNKSCDITGHGDGTDFTFPSKIDGGATPYDNWTIRNLMYI